MAISTIVIRWEGFSINSQFDQTVNSLLTIHTNENKQIVQHIEEWDHQRDASKEDGFFGMLNDYRKEMTASITDKFVSKEPPKKN